MILDLAHSSRSEKYKVIKTNDVIKQLETKGFNLVDFKATHVRNESRQGYQKHFAIIEHPDLLKSENGLRYQLLLTNSHDGTTAFRVDFGVFRLVCSNGLVLGNTFGGISQRHQNFIMSDFEENLDQFVARLPELKCQIDLMRQMTLNSDQKRQFYKDALSLKVDNPILLDVPVRRIEDNNNDLFTTFNVMQEHIIRGGLRYAVKQEKEGEIVTIEKTLRKMRSFNAQTEINKKLFDLADNYLKIA